MTIHLELFHKHFCNTLLVRTYVLMHILAVEKFKQYNLNNQINVYGN